MIKLLICFSAILLASCSSNVEKTATNITKTEILDTTAKVEPVDTIVPPPKWKKIYEFNTEERLAEYGANNKESKFRIITKMGDIEVELFEDTPLHRASMILMIKKGIFNSTNFYRVTKNFIIQAGLTDGPSTSMRMDDIGYYKIPPEIKESHPHIRGAFAMAGADMKPGQHRDKRSNPFTFYMVKGAKQTEKSLKGISKAVSHLSFSIDHSRIH